MASMTRRNTENITKFWSGSKKFISQKTIQKSLRLEIVPAYEINYLQHVSKLEAPPLLGCFLRCAAVLRIRIRIRIHHIHMYLGLLDPDPDPSVRGMDPALDPDLDPSITKQKK
jgi:hypothetical protein